jgi:hypothetical protein
LVHDYDKLGLVEGTRHMLYKPPKDALFLYRRHL